MLTIKLLGKHTAFFEEDRVLQYQTRKAEALFYYLVVTSVPADRNMLADLFWSEMSTSNALKNLRVILPNLRSQLGDYLQANSRQVAFDRSLPNSVDLYTLQQLLQSKSTDVERNFKLFLELYQGELLNGLTVVRSQEFEHWLSKAREALTLQISSQLQNWSEKAEEQKNYKLGLQITQEWLTLEPWNENAHRFRMKFFWLNNQRSAALLQYNICFDFLEEELGVEPGTETKRLYALIQRSEEQPPDLEPTILPAVAQPVMRKIAHNLPRQFTSFVAREQEIALLKRYFVQDKYPLVSITGEGGMGKTRLAVKFAETLLNEAATSHFTDGIWFIPCITIHAEGTVEEDLAELIGNTLSLKFQGTTSLFTQLCTYLADKSLLLILDNFEHLSNHTQLIWSLLNASQKLQLLVTSRHQLALQSARTLLLKGLEIVPAAEVQSQQLTTSETPGMQLFIDRAQKVWPHFSLLTDKDISQLEQICQLLDGNPLALELAATLVLSYNMQELYSMLSKNYLLLATDLSDIPLRQRSMESCIEYSWAMLPQDMADLLAQCSVFHGGFSFAAAEKVANIKPQILVNFLQKSFLQVDESSRQILIHQVIHQFLNTKLEQKPTLRQQTYLQHATFYLRRISDWWGKREDQHDISLLRLDLENIYAAWDWALDNQQFDLLNSALKALLNYHLYANRILQQTLRVERYQQKVQQLLFQQPELANNQAFLQLRGGLIYMQGVIHYRRFDQPNMQRAIELFQEALQLLTAIAVYNLHADINRFLSFALTRLGHPDAARAHIDISLDYARRVNDPYAHARARLTICEVEMRTGNLQPVAEHLHEIAELIRQYPDRALELTYLDTLGLYHHTRGNWQNAYESYHQALQLANNPYPIHAMHSMGNILQQSGRLQEAKEFYEQLTKLPDPEGIYKWGAPRHTLWLLDWADLYINWQKPEENLFYSQLAERQAYKHNLPQLIARASKAQGVAYYQQQKYELAQERLERAQALFRQEEVRGYLCATLARLVQLQLALKNDSLVRQYTEELWDTLRNRILNPIEAKPIKAYYTCWLGFSRLNDSRSAEARQLAYDLLQQQRAEISDTKWKQSFVENIPEHKALLQG